MSIHKSLRNKGMLSRQRSVLSRWERVLKLQDVGRWKEGDKVTGLPKVRTKWKIRKRKKEAAAVPGAPAAGAPAAAGAAAKGAAAPAKGAAPAAGAKGAAAPAGGAKAAAAPAADKGAAKKK